MDQFTHTNISFDFLKHSPEFLKALVDNLNTCILILNKNMELQAFNNPIRTIFGRNQSLESLMKKCGDVIGCSYAVDEETECGTTSHCKYCDLRLNALECYASKSFVSKKLLSRDFYDSNGTKRLKYLQYDITTFEFENERYIIVLITDVTDLHNSLNIINEQKKEIQDLYKKLKAN